MLIMFWKLIYDVKPACRRAARLAVRHRREGGTSCCPYCVPGELNRFGARVFPTRARWEDTNREDRRHAAALATGASSRAGALRPMLGRFCDWRSGLGANSAPTTAANGAKI